MIERTPTDRRHDKLAVAGCMDQLTGILNHSMILAHLQEALSLHKVYPVPFCAICISIDGLGEDSREVRAGGGRRDAELWWRKRCRAHCGRRTSWGDGWSRNSWRS